MPQASNHSGIAGATPRRIGILAGGGELPLEIAKLAAARGHSIQIIALEGEADGDFSGFPVVTLNWGKFGRIVKTLRAAGVEDVIMAGRVKRPVIRKIRPDFGLIKALGTVIKIVTSSGDDNLLRAVLQCFESYGFRVIGAADAAPELLINQGVQGAVALSASAGKSIKRGFETVRVMGPHDVGQAVVVADGRVEAIEAAEGTDAMLDRVAEQRRGGRRGGVLVKRPKPGQELRVDMPAIGPETVRRAAAAGLDGVVVLAGQALIVSREETLRAADQAGLFVAGVADPGSEAPRVAHAEMLTLISLTQIQPDKSAPRDAARAAGVLASLDAVETCRAVAVARRYILTVESGEGVSEMLARAASLRQWGDQTSKKRTGLVVVRAAADIDAAVIAATAKAGLRGLVVLQNSSPVRPVFCAEADRLGLFIAQGTASKV